MWDKAACLPAGPVQLRMPDLEPWPMYVVPRLVPPVNVSPTIAPVPASVPLPAFVERSKHSEENAMEHFSDTSSTACPDDERALRNISAAGLLGMQKCVADVTPQSASHQLASKPRSKKASWQLVWCCERCNKPASAEFKESLQRTVKTLGGNLHCLKKADKIKSHPLKSRYILMADWREAKPILEIFAEIPSMTRPALMIIICSTGRSYENAVQYVERVSTMSFAMRCEVLHGQNDAPEDPRRFHALLQMAVRMFAQHASHAYAVNPMPGQAISFTL